MDPRRAIVLIALLAAGPALAGEWAPAMVWTGTAPAGACAGSRVAFEVSTGKAWCCSGGSWSACGQVVTSSSATALATNGSNCPAGQAPLGVDAQGNVEGCWTPSAPGGAPKLDEVLNPSSAKTFGMTTNPVRFLFSAPSASAPDYEGAFNVEASGAFTGDLLHVHQFTGNPGPGSHLIHAEASDPDVVPLHLVSGNADALTTSQRISAGRVLLGPDSGINSTLSVQAHTVTGNDTFASFGYDGVNPTRAKVHAAGWNGVLSLYDSGTNETAKIAASGNSFLPGALTLNNGGDLVAHGDVYAGGGDVLVREHPAVGAGLRLHHNGTHGYVDWDGELNFRGGGAAGDNNTSLTIKTDAAVWAHASLYSPNLCLTNDCVKRFTADGAGIASSHNITAPSFTGNVTGTASSASALAADPADCVAPNFARGVNASGTAQCAQVAYSEVSGTPAAYVLPDATAGVTGGLRLTGDLGGTATSPAVVDDSHAHTTSTISGLDAGADFSAGTLPQARGGTGAGALTCSGSQKLTSNGTAYSCAADADTVYTHPATHPASMIEAGTMPGPMAIGSGYLGVTGDLGLARAGGTTGALYFGDGSGYLYWSGTGYQLAGGPLDLAAPLAGSEGGGGAALPTCTGTQKLTANGTAWSCAADETGTGTFDPASNQTITGAWSFPATLSAPHLAYTNTLVDTATSFNAAQWLTATRLGSFFGPGDASGPPGTGAAWWHLINMRHRGGINDGNEWGMQITAGMTADSDRMWWRTMNSGAWQTWKEIWHSGNSLAVSQAEKDTWNAKLSSVPAATDAAVGGVKVPASSTNTTTGKLVWNATTGALENATDQTGASKVFLSGDVGTATTTPVQVFSIALAANKTNHVEGYLMVTTANASTGTPQPGIMTGGWPTGTTCTFTQATAATTQTVTTIFAANTYSAAGTAPSTNTYCIPFWCGCSGAGCGANLLIGLRSEGAVQVYAKAGSHYSLMVYP